MPLQLLLRLEKETISCAAFEGITVPFRRLKGWKNVGVIAALVLFPLAVSYCTYDGF